MALVPALLLVLLLALAAACDIRTRRIPNALSLTGVVVGLGWHGWHGGGPGLLRALEGVGAASLALLPYAARGLGAGDVKLLVAVGALAGPVFLLWTLLGAVFAGAALGLAWAARRGVLRHTVGNTLLALPLLRAGAGLTALASASQAGRMPMAPAIALGAAFAFWVLHLRILP